MSRFSRVVVAVAVFLLPCAGAQGQWLKLKTPNLPRTADGKFDAKAPPPRVSGAPDLSGLWRYEPDPYANNVVVDLKPEEIKPEATALYKQRMEDLAKDDPSTFRCLPSGPRMAFAPQGWVRIVQTPTVVAMIYEDLTSRQIFMDGRPLPKDPNPSFMGYSIGRWDGDTLVVETNNLKDDGWLDVRGSPFTDQARITERFRRVNFGRLEIDITIDDPKAYTKPFTVRVNQEIMVDSEMIEFICNENNQFLLYLDRAGLK
jgi:hypothetical protein